MKGIKRAFIFILSCMLLVFNVYANENNTSFEMEELSLNIPSLWSKTDVEKAIELGFVPISLRDNYKRNITRSEFAKMAMYFLSVQYGYQAEYIIQTWYNDDKDYSMSAFVNTYCNAKLNRYARPFDMYAGGEFIYDENGFILGRKGEENYSYNAVGNIELPKIPFEKTEDFSDWDYVELAYNIGIVNGVSETEFNPNGNITRQEASIMLMRVYKNYAEYNGANNDFVFADDSQISDWAKEDVYNINKLGVMQGVGNNSFAPLDGYTVEQAVVSFLRLYENAPVSRKNKNIEPLVDCEQEIENTLKGNLAGSSFIIEEKIDCNEYSIIYGKWNRRPRGTDYRLYVFYKCGGYRQLTDFVPSVNDIEAVTEVKVSSDEKIIEFVLNIEDTFRLYNQLNGTENVHDIGKYRFEFDLETGNLVDLEK